MSTQPEGLTVYADSSLLDALLSPDDSNHERVKGWAGREKRPLGSSVLMEAEVFRALERRGAGAQAVNTARRLIGRVTRIELTAGIRDPAETVRPASIRTLDAIHVATALSIDRTAFGSLDERQRVAAEEMGLELLEVS